MLKIWSQNWIYKSVCDNHGGLYGDGAGHGVADCGGRSGGLADGQGECIGVGHAGSVATRVDLCAGVALCHDVHHNLYGAQHCRHWFRYGYAGRLGPALGHCRRLGDRCRQSQSQHQRILSFLAMLLLVRMFRLRLTVPFRFRILSKKHE